jgi:hypothetical protein
MRSAYFHALLMCGLIALTISLAAPSNAAQQGQASQQDLAAHAGIRTAINHYFKGHATGDAAHMRKAFLPTAHIEGIRDGKFTSWTLDEYCALFSGRSASDEGIRVRRIDSIDASGDSAMAKATLDHGPTVFTDYFVLLNVGGEWRIANKVYYGRKK